MSTLLVDRRAFLAITGAGVGSLLQHRQWFASRLRIAVVVPPPDARTAADDEALAGFFLGAEELARTASLFGSAATVAIHEAAHPEDVARAAHAAIDAGATAILALGGTASRATVMRAASERGRIYVEVLGDTGPASLAAAGAPARDPWVFRIAPDGPELAAAALQAAHAAAGWDDDTPWLIVTRDPAAADAIRALDAAVARAADRASLLHAAAHTSPADPGTLADAKLAIAVDAADATLLQAHGVGARSAHVTVGLLGPIHSSVAPSSLAATSWLPRLSRFGAAQLNDRHRARFGSGMTGPAWCGWFALKALGESALRARTSEPEPLRRQLLSARFDGHKGAPLSFSQDQRLMHPLYVAGVGGPFPFEARPLITPSPAREQPRTGHAAFRVAGALMIAACMLSAAVPARAQAPAARPAAAAATSAPASELLWVSNEESRDVSVVRARDMRVIARIPVGERPRGIQASADGRRIYVALSDEHPNVESGRDAVAVIDTRTRRIIARHSVGTDPEQFGLSPDGRRLYAANEDAGTASVTDLTTGRVVATLVVGIEPEGVAVSPDGRWVYITAETSNSVSVLDTRSNTIVANMLVDVRPRGVAFAPDGHRAYVTAEIGGTLAAVDVATHEVIGTVDLADGDTKPVGLAVSRDGRTVYVANGAANAVSVVDAASLRVTGSIPVGRRPWGVALSPDGRRLYVANGLSNEVSVVDTGTRRVVARVAVGSRPWGVAVTR